MIKAVILTISDRAVQGIYEDQSGKLIRAILEKNNFQIADYDILPDDSALIKRALIRYADKYKVNLIVTSGGTGLGPRDFTPEATGQVIDKEVPGFSELMRRQGLESTKRAVLSRGITGIRKGTLIINLPGSPRGARESLESVLEIIPHALTMIAGGGH